MQREVIHQKLAAATIMETIVALLIVMISFSAGLVIYNRIISAGVNDQELRAGLQSVVVADSLLQVTNIQDQELISVGQRFNVAYSSTEYEGLLLMTLTCTDDSGKLLAKQIRIIERHESR